MESPTDVASTVVAFVLVVASVLTVLVVCATVAFTERVSAEEETRVSGAGMVTLTSVVAEGRRVGAIV